MPLQMVRNDITTIKVDAIVNAAKNSLLGGGGVDGAIHRAAGPELLEECRTLGGCPTGQAKITKGYRLPAHYVIHTVGPIWRGGDYGERELLISAYRSSLELAVEHGCQTVAFPLISSGAYGYPKDQALKVAVDTIGDFLLCHDMTVCLVIFDRAAYTIGGKLFSNIAAYIDDHYVDEHTQSRWDMSLEAEPMEAQLWCASAPLSLDEALGQLDESFSQMLLRKIDERGITDAQCYKKANIDAVETAGELGIAPDRAVNYHCDSQGTQLNYETISQAVSAVRCSAPLDAHWKDAIEADFHGRRSGHR